MSETIRILGLGSPFGGDQFGWCVIEQLRQNHALQTLTEPRIELLSADRPGINLLHLLHGHAHVILIDALTHCPNIGRIYRLEKTELLQHTGVLSTHGIGVAETLALGEQLGQLPDRLVLFGLCVDPNEQVIHQKWIDDMEEVLIDELLV